jgi:RNA recognition motif-containing protein
MDIYVGNLPYELTEDGLMELFKEFGSVDSAKIVKDFESGRSKGFGFVLMPDGEEGNAAIEALNGKTVMKRALKVNEAQPKKPREFRSNDAPRGGFRGGDRPAGGGGGGENRFRRERRSF